MAPQGQGLKWAEVLCCPFCLKIFSPTKHAVNLYCSHAVCVDCLTHKMDDDHFCLVDKISGVLPLNVLPKNRAMMKIVGVDLDEGLEAFIQHDGTLTQQDQFMLENIDDSMCGMASYLRKIEAERGGSVWSEVLSRTIQRKIIHLICQQLAEPTGRLRAARQARQIAERILCEVMLGSQTNQSTSHQLWTAVRARGCQFLGPAMQDDVLTLILLTMGDRALIARKTLVLYVVQRMKDSFPQTSKTCVGHVVQLLYRASCFNVLKRDGESSLMQLKEEYSTIEALRREHDTQIVSIAMDAGLRIAPEQWSSLLYGDLDHRSQMQSIIDKLQTAASFAIGIEELRKIGEGDEMMMEMVEALKEVDGATRAIYEDTTLSTVEWAEMREIMESLREVVDKYADVLARRTAARADFLQAAVREGASDSAAKAASSALIRQTLPPPAAAAAAAADASLPMFKTKWCRELPHCPRADRCTYAHSTTELRVPAGLNRPRGTRGAYNRMIPVDPGPMPGGGGGAPPPPPQQPTRWPYAPPPPQVVQSQLQQQPRMAPPPPPQQPQMHPPMMRPYLPPPPPHHPMQQQPVPPLMQQPPTMQPMMMMQQHHHPMQHQPQPMQQWQPAPPPPQMAAAAAAAGPPPHVSWLPQNGELEQQQQRQEMYWGAPQVPVQKVNIMGASSELSEMEQLHLRREEIISRLGPLSIEQDDALNGPSTSGDQNDDTHVSFTVASSVLDDRISDLMQANAWNANPIIELPPIPPGFTPVLNSTTTSEETFGVLSELALEGAASAATTACVKARTSSLTTTTTTVRTMCPAPLYAVHTTSSGCSTATVQADCSTMHVMDSMTEPMTTPVIVPTNSVVIYTPSAENAPGAVVAANGAVVAPSGAVLTPAHQPAPLDTTHESLARDAARLPMVIQPLSQINPVQAEDPADIISSTLDRIVDVRERLTEVDVSGSSSVVKTQLEVELVIASRQIEQLDPLTTQNCLLKELEAVERKIEEIESGSNSTDSHQQQQVLQQPMQPMQPVPQLQHPYPPVQQPQQMTAYAYPPQVMHMNMHGMQ